MSQAPAHDTHESLRALAESTSVAQIMSRSVVCVAPEARIDSVTAMFLERGISSAPMVDDNWHPLGMVSKTDLLRVISEEGSVPEPLADHCMPPRGIADHTRVRDITMPHVLSLHEEASVSVAAALMAYEGVHRLPIVASSGEVVGVVSTLDIIRWLARSTEMAAHPSCSAK